MRCGGCKFWGRFITNRHGRPQPDQGGEWRQCGRVVHDDDAACRPTDELIDWYGEDKAREMAARPVRAELAVVQDGSGYHAALKSRADFGCVLFQPAEGE